MRTGQILSACFIFSFGSTLVVEDSGVVPIHRGDIMILFYVTVVNDCEDEVQVEARGQRCCDAQSPQDPSACEFMKLTGGDMGRFASKEKRNITLFYITPIPHGRQGHCEVELWFGRPGGDTKALNHRIPFDTLVRRGEVPCTLADDYYDASSVASCATSDLEAAEGCAPVDCRMKYGGARPFFCRERSRCVAAPECAGPDQAYDPADNACRHLGAALSEEDERLLRRPGGPAGAADACDAPSPYLPRVRCHHGRPEPATGLCLCDEGWGFAPIDSPGSLQPSTFVLHLCTERQDRDNLAYVFILPILSGVGAALALALCAVLVYLCWLRVGAAPRAATMEAPICVCSAYHDGPTDEDDDDGGEGGLLLNEDGRAKRRRSRNRTNRLVDKNSRDTSERDELKANSVWRASSGQSNARPAPPSSSGESWSSSPNSPPPPPPPLPPPPSPKESRSRREEDDVEGQAVAPWRGVTSDAALPTRPTPPSRHVTFAGPGVTQGPVLYPPRIPSGKSSWQSFEGRRPAAANASAAATASASASATAASATSPTGNERDPGGELRPCEAYQPGSYNETLRYTNAAATASTITGGSFNEQAGDLEILPPHLREKLAGKAVCAPPVCPGKPPPKECQGFSTKKGEVVQFGAGESDPGDKEEEEEEDDEEQNPEEACRDFIIKCCHGVEFVATRSDKITQSYQPCQPYQQCAPVPRCPVPPPPALAGTDSNQLMFLTVRTQKDVASRSSQVFATAVAPTHGSNRGVMTLQLRQTQGAGQGDGGAPWPAALPRTQRPAAAVCPRQRRALTCPAKSARKHAAGTYVRDCPVRSSRQDDEFWEQFMPRWRELRSDTDDSR